MRVITVVVLRHSSRVCYFLPSIRELRGEEGRGRVYSFYEARVQSAYPVDALHERLGSAWYVLPCALSYIFILTYTAGQTAYFGWKAYIQDKATKVTFFWPDTRLSIRTVGMIM